MEIKATQNQDGKFKYSQMDGEQNKNKYFFRNGVIIVWNDKSHGLQQLKVVNSIP